MFPILNLLDNTPQSIPNTLHGITPQEQPQRRIRAVSQLPDELRAFDCRRGLSVAEPGYHTPSVARGGGRVGVRFGGWLHEEVAPCGEGFRAGVGSVGGEGWVSYGGSRSVGGRRTYSSRRARPGSTSVALTPKDSTSYIRLSTRPSTAYFVAQYASDCQ